MDLITSIAEVRRLAEKAETPVEQFMRSVEVVAARQAEIQASNRSSPDHRALIDSYLEGLNGNINPEMSAGDIAINAGVPLNRGTSQYASRGKKRLLLTYKKQATATS